MGTDFSNYKYAFSAEDFDLKDNQDVFSRVVYTNEDQIIIVIPEYPKFKNHLAIIFGYENQEDKYLFDLTTVEYNDHLIEILLKYNFGDSKLCQLDIFNKIQRTIANYYLDIKEHKYLYTEVSKNSTLFCLTILIGSSKQIKVCQIDEDAQILSFKRRALKIVQKDIIKGSNQNYIYIMHDRKRNLYKIGFSKNPTYREKTLQSDEPDILIRKMWLAPQKFERLLQNKFESKWVRGEWYSLNSEDLIEIDKIMNKFSQSFNESVMKIISSIFLSLSKV